MASSASARVVEGSMRREGKVSARGYAASPHIPWRDQVRPLTLLLSAASRSSVPRKWARSSLACIFLRHRLCKNSARRVAICDRGAADVEFRTAALTNCIGQVAVSADLFARTYPLPS